MLAAGPRDEKKGPGPVLAPVPNRRGVGENGDPGVVGTLDLPTRGTKNGEWSIDGVGDAGLDGPLTISSSKSTMTLISSGFSSVVGAGAATGAGAGAGAGAGGSDNENEDRAASNWADGFTALPDRLGPVATAAVFAVVGLYVDGCVTDPPCGADGLEAVPNRGAMSIRIARGARR